MIDEYSLMESASRFRDIRQLERDYLLVLLLHELSSAFAKELIFKGGTALKYFYNLNRFSEDLDFSYSTKGDLADKKRLSGRIEAALDSFGRQYKITEKEHRANKEGGEIAGINYGIRVEGPLNHRLNQLQNIKIDISLRSDVILKPEPRYFSPAYQDIATFSVNVMDINEILAEKVAAALERTRMRDLYDLYYLLVIRKIKYDETLVEEKMRKRGEEFKSGALAEKLEIVKNKMKWRSELAYLVTPLPDNMEVAQKLKEALGL